MSVLVYICMNEVLSTSLVTNSAVIPPVAYL